MNIKMNDEISRDIVEVLDFDFEENFLDKTQSTYVNDLWPLVYVLYDKKIKKAYVGETTNAQNRMQAHLKHKEKNKLSKVKLLISEKFNKSAALDIESKLISYMLADNSFSLLNANLGIANHNYYQKNDLYLKLFRQIWNILRSESLVKHSLESLSNSDLFKYSPYKSLDNGQLRAINQILDSYLNPNTKTTIINGGAGTGKSIIAIYLFKLLNSNLEDFEFRELDEGIHKEIFTKIEKIKKINPNLSMKLVVPMSSFRKTLQNIFKKIEGLNPKMVVGPSEATKETTDLILVDESHRLRKRVNLGSYYKSFDDVCLRFNLDKNKTNELEWMSLCSKNLVLFYDSSQSIKPSDTNKKDYDILKEKESTIYYELYSQFRVKGGEEYSKFVSNLLNCTIEDNIYSNNNYQLLLFDSFEDFKKEISKRNKEYGLSRMIAGYSWKWASKANPKQYDMEIEGHKLRWNSTNIDWINTQNSINEVGCIHTTQGYDLNYGGIIFGDEIGYDPIKEEIIIDKNKYEDKNGKNSIKEERELKKYILNIYKTIMLRGIKGTYIYVRDENLRNYFSHHIKKFENKREIVSLSSTKNNIDSIPVFIGNSICGYINDIEDEEFKHNNNIYAIKVDDNYENTNLDVIPKNSICLFEKINSYESLNGYLVLVSIENKDYILEFQNQGKKSYLVFENKENIRYDSNKHTIKSIFRKCLGFEEEKYILNSNHEVELALADSKKEKN